MKMFSKSTVLAGMTAALLGFSGAAVADPTPPSFVVDTISGVSWRGITTWTSSVPRITDSGDTTATGYPNATAASIDATSPTLLVLTGANVYGDYCDGCTLPSSSIHTAFTTLASGAVPVTVTFNWNYSTADGDGPVNDQAIFVHYNPNDQNVLPLSGVALSDSTQWSTGPDGVGAIQQSGPFSRVVNPGEVYGFTVLSTDGGWGAATLTISSFSVSPVPEPGSLAMLTAGLMVVVAARKRKQQQS